MRTIARRLAEERSRWTLARRFAVLSMVLLVVVVGAFGAAAYRGVRDAAVLRASERLASVARELGTAATRGGQARIAVLQDLARNDAVRRLVITRGASAQAGDDSQARETPALNTDTIGTHPAIDSLVFARRTDADSTLMAVQLWSASGAQRYGPTVSGKDAVQLAEAMRRAHATDSITRSPLYGVGQQIRLWSVVPVRVNGSTQGFLAEQRFVGGSAQAENLIAKLTGEDVRVLYASRGLNEWGSIRGVPVPSPIGAAPVASLPDTGTVRREDANGEPVYVAAGNVAGTPWRIVLVQTEASILAPPREFLRELLMIGAVLVLLGALATWGLSQFETRPLRDLRRAADALAEGEYGQVVTPAGGAETAALGRAFNTMSLHISGTHATLAERNSELLEANEAKARFLAVMSHELRTPLNAIGGHAELLALGIHGPVTDAQRDAMERVLRAKDRLLHLVSDILHYTRIDASPLPLSLARVSLDAVFDLVRETVADAFARKNVQLQMRPTSAVAHADEARVQQVLINLVMNALQFTPPRGRVTVTADSDPRWTTIQVHDTGVGIAADKLEAIFEPFVQADDSLTRRSGGAGLGLAIVRQLVTAMDGSVAVRSVEGQGATFIITLPATPGQADDHAPDDAHRAPDAASSTR